MKRFAFATLAALAAVVASEQQAKAWFNFSLGSTTQMNVAWGGHHRCGNSSEPWPQGTAIPSFGNPWGGAGYGYGYGAPSYTGPMPQGSGSVGSGSPMGYFVPQMGAYNYPMLYGDSGLQNAYYQAPPYWYGR